MPRLGKRRAPVQDEEEEDGAASPEPQAQRRRTSAANNEDDEAFGEGAGEATQGDSNLDQMVKNLVRLALASEFSRTPIRRSDISAKVLGAHARQFRAVFHATQEQLRAVFGMEMIELPAREKITVQQKRNAAKSQSQAQKTVNAWILTSILPPRFRVPEILPPPSVPTSELEAQYAGLYTVVVSLIALQGGALADARLERYMSRMGVNETTTLTQHASISLQDKTEKLLKKMERDGYIVKVRDNSGGDETIEWIMGPRGKIEVGPNGVRGVARELYGESMESEELERRLDRSLGSLDAANQAELPELRKRGRKSKGNGEDGDDGGNQGQDEEEDDK